MKDEHDSIKTQFDLLDEGLFMVRNETKKFETVDKKFKEYQGIIGKLSEKIGTNYKLIQDLKEGSQTMLEAVTKAEDELIDIRAVQG